MEKQLPPEGRAVYPTLLEISFICLLVFALSGTCKASSFKKKEHIGRVIRTCQPSRVVLSPQRYACALHLREASGRLPGRTECDHAPNQWTPRLSEQHSTAGRSSSIILQSLCASSGLH